LYSITRNGITTQDIKNAKTPIDFATVQKKRNYFGFSSWDSPEGQKEIRGYAGGLSAKLKKIQIIQFIKENPKTSGFIFILIAGMIAYGYYAYKKLKKK
jgi:hypothetical protein